MRRVIFRCSFLALCAAAALVPLFAPRNASPALAVPPWPGEFEGRPLHLLPSTSTEEAFNRGFPGAVARFTDGDRQLILRWVTAGTRKLHSSADCFRGLGYNVASPHPIKDQDQVCWSSFTAATDQHRLRVRERIIDSHSRQSWTNVSAWFWSTALHGTHGPWLAITVIESEGS